MDPYMHETHGSAPSQQSSDSTPAVYATTFSPGYPEQPPPAQLGSTIPATAGADSRVPAQTVPAACLACRSKHLKCDGSNPCSRCIASSSECVYVASRRGYKGPRRASTANPNKRHASDSPDTTGGSCPMLLGMPTAATPTMTTFNPALTMPNTPIMPYASTPDANTLQMYRQPYYNHLDGTIAPLNPPPPPQRSIPDQCLDAFYFYFYPGHPAVLPKSHILKMAKERSLNHLISAMRWVGSLYIETGPSRATFFDETMRLMHAPETPKDGFLVQAMIIAIIGLDGCRQNEKAREILADAERISLEIGLYSRAFATTHGGGNPRLEESWRRTWWDLYVVCGMIAGVHRQTNFFLYDVVADVGLPCEEDQFLSGDIPRPMYLEDFDDQVFSGEDRMFSSFAYRIASIRILGRMMRLPQSGFSPEDSVDKIETLLSNWRLHLPRFKRDCLFKDGQLDEMMFQAHMINHACSIQLHQPLSQLDSSPAREVTACAPHRAVDSGDSFNIHTRHIVTAACEISKMVTYNVPITSHTHFFTCVLTLSSIVHLSKWALYFIQDDDDLREQIRLNIGALTKLSSVWKAAANAGGQVKGVAQEIYRNRKAQQANPTFWVGLTQEEIVSSMSADEGIMSEINMLPGVPESIMPPPSMPHSMA
ncbi:N-terminal binuclear Zn cluster-containing/DNA binding domain-containing protein [Xylariaceae sp. FL0255]|nr:N-terminal binuclear Zn cluster-containing/DNA binding domain-containing protein [Xylariaceae sp. FL0255]